MLRDTLIESITEPDGVFRDNDIWQSPRMKHLTVKCTNGHQTTIHSKDLKYNILVRV